MSDKLYRVIFLCDLHATRVILAISELVWGIALLLPGNTFIRSATYHGMSHVMTEELWGILWLCTGLMQLYIVYKDDYHSRQSVLFAAYNMLIWWLVVVSLYLCVWPINAVASGDLALCIASTWIFIRSGWEAKPVRGVERWM